MFSTLLLKQVNSFLADEILVSFYVIFLIKLYYLKKKISIVIVIIIDKIISIVIVIIIDVFQAGKLDVYFETEEKIMSKATLVSSSLNY